MTSEALALCVGDVEQFLSDVWERDALLRHGTDATSLLDLDDVDALLADAALRAPAVRLVKAGDPVAGDRYLRSARVGSRTIGDLVDPGRVHALFADGATVVLQGLHRFWPPLTAFCRALEQTLSHPVQANAYLTPPVASGLRVHADAHDVFALQTHGTKQWVVYPFDADLDDLPAPRLDTTVEKGDCLYVPRGMPHAARTVDSASLHITIGVRVTTWRDAVQRAMSTVLADPAYGKALPTGYAHDPGQIAGELNAKLKEAGARLADVDADPIATGLAEDFVSARRPALTGQLRELLAADEIDDDTVLFRRPGTMATVRTGSEPGRVTLLLGDRRLSLPESSETALRWVLDRDQFVVGDLSPLLDAAGRGVLCRRLVREGVLVRGG